jgi:hypothetical protein
VGTLFLCHRFSGLLPGEKSFWSAFQESDGSWSWGRVAGTFTLLTACWGFIHVVRITNAIPDPMTLAGLITYAVGPFVATKGITAMSRPANTDKL